MTTESTAAPFPPGWPMESDWTEVLRSYFATPEFQALIQFVTEERKQHTVYPPETDVFNAFRWTPFSKTKVVILGQDPYHGTGQAHGLSFSVRDGQKLPPSLKNIFKELAADLDCTLPQSFNGDLTKWAAQGVLLLNTVLTVRAGEANSHARRGWEDFTHEVIRRLGQQQQQHIVFLLWGKPAEKKAALIGGWQTIITAPHPSPLSAHRGFLGSRIFSRTNQVLIQAGQMPIDWF